MELVGPAAGKTEQSETKTAKLRVYFENPKHIAPSLANLCQVTASPTMLQLDFGYLPPLEVIEASRHPQDIGAIVHNRITLEPDTARQLRDLLDQALQSVSK